MTNKIKSFVAYIFCVLLAIIITSCADTGLPVKVGYEDDALKGTYSSKGGLDFVLKGYKKDGVEGFYSEDEGLEFIIDKTSNK
jgi:hypothetical protein